VTHSLQLAQSVLPRLKERLDAATSTISERCTHGGKLNSALLDQWQVPCFELAWAAAEFLAMQTYVVNISEQMQGIQASGDQAFNESLCFAFVAETLVSVISRLELIAIDLDQDLALVRALATHADFDGLRQLYGNSQFLGGVGQRVIASQGSVDLIALPSDVALAQSALRRFAADVVEPLATIIHRSDLTVPESILGPLRDMGVFGLSIPENYGGSAPVGMDGAESNSALTMIAVTEALSEASLAAAGSLITRPEILARALLAGGTEEQKTHWLPKIALGEPLCAIAITEPDYGSDVASLMLRASRVENGWRLNGAKTWCTFAGKAGLLMVVVRTGDDATLGHRGLSLMLVEKPSTAAHSFEFEQSPGAKLIGKAIATIGYRGMHSFDLAFENFFVPDSCVIGGEAGLGQGFYFTMMGMVGGRMQTAARACGVMTAALKASATYVQDRRVFAAPLASFPLTQVKIARMGAKLAACRNLTYAVGHMVDAGGGQMQASLVKLFACRSAEQVTREALQLHGGMGYAEEMPVSRYFVDARVLSIFEGAEETLALKVVAKSLLEAALTTGEDKLSPIQRRPQG
jgi:(2S)-methylsuccinyl-CoA dehydrogenase